MPVTTFEILPCCPYVGDFGTGSTQPGSTTLSDLVSKYWTVKTVSFTASAELAESDDPCGKALCWTNAWSASEDIDRFPGEYDMGQLLCSPKPSFSWSKSIVIPIEYTPPEGAGDGCDEPEECDYTSGEINVTFSFCATENGDLVYPLITIDGYVNSVAPPCGCFSCSFDPGSDDCSPPREGYSGSVSFSSVFDPSDSSLTSCGTANILGISVPLRYTTPSSDDPTLSVSVSATALDFFY